MHVSLPLGGKICREIPSAIMKKYIMEKNYVENIAKYTVSRET